MQMPAEIYAPGVALRVYDLRKLARDVQVAGLHHLMNRRIRHDYRIGLRRLLRHRRRPARFRGAALRARASTSRRPRILVATGDWAAGDVSVNSSGSLPAFCTARITAIKLVARVDLARDRSQRAVLAENADQTAKRGRRGHGTSQTTAKTPRSFRPSEARAGIEPLSQYTYEQQTSL